MFKKFDGIFIIMLATLGTLSAVAGVSTSGGGYAVVCRNQMGQLVSAELLDLFEARMVYKYTLLNPSGSVQTDIQNSAKIVFKLQSVSPNDQAKYLQTFLNNTTKFQTRVVWLPDSSRLPKANDLGPVSRVLQLLPHGCRLEQMAYMEDSSFKVYIVKPIWDVMNSLNQAALKDHELYYVANRHSFLSPDIDSSYTRRMVGIVFSTNPFPGVRYGIPKGSKEYEIHAQGNPYQGIATYYVYDSGTRSNGVAVTRFQFVILADRVLFTQTFVDIPQKALASQKFPIQSRELIGWSAILVADPQNPSRTKVRILNERNQFIQDLN